MAESVLTVLARKRTSKIFDSDSVWDSRARKELASNWSEYVETDTDVDESVAELRDGNLISIGLCDEPQRTGAPPVCEQQTQKPPEKQADTTDANANPAGAKTKLTTSKKQQKLQYEWVHVINYDGVTVFGPAELDQAKKALLSYLEANGFRVCGLRPDGK
jgi:hypothetical protein